MKKLLWSLTVFGVILILPVNGVLEFDKMERLPDFNGTNVYQTENNVYSKAKPTMVELTFVKNPVERSAVCLDGSPSGYHFHPGSGSGAKNWIVQFEGGGWCGTIEDCVNMKKTSHGSSKYMEKQIPFTGILSDKAAENPDFYNWNKVKVRSCDGGSLMGDNENKDAKLQFRGKRIWTAVMVDLMTFNGLREAKQIRESLTPKSADPNGSWSDCRLNIAKCNASQIKFLQGFRTHMVNLISGFTKPSKNGVFINSCFTHCQTENQDTWYSKNSPAVKNKRIAVAVGDWYFERRGAKLIDCAYPCDKTCRNEVVE
ncbi:hypothetical protein Bca101_075036 [Brassica carinata]